MVSPRARETPREVAGEILARELDDDTPVLRFSHGATTFF
jgi:hypothetical protein